MDGFLGMSQDTLILTLFGGVFVLAGLWFVHYSLGQVREDRASRHWPRLPAVLARIEVVRTIRENDEGRDRTPTYSCVLDYEYRADAQPRMATRRISARAGREEAQKIADFHALGEVIYLHVDPSAPERYRTTLRPVYSGLSWLAGTFGFCGFGAAIIWIGHAYY